MEKIFYVYEHVRPDTGKVFYVGKGCGTRAYKMGRRNRMHGFIRDKLEKLDLMIDVRIIANNLSEEDAFALECERIILWRNQGIELANFTDGGEGASGCVKTEEAKRKFSAKMKGVPKTPEHRAKISAAKKGGRWKVRGIKFKPRSEEHKAALSKALKGRLVWNKGLSGIYSDETRKKMSDANIGKTLSEETKQKISSVSKGRKQSEDHIRKRALAQIGNTRGRANKGKPKSPEHIAKMSANMKAKWAAIKSANTREAE